MESKLWTLSRDNFNQALAATTAHLQASFNAKSRKFDGECKILKQVSLASCKPGPNGPSCPVIIQFGKKITILNYLHLTLNIFFHRILHGTAGSFKARLPLYVQKDLRDSVREEFWRVYRLLQGSRDILWTWEYRPGGGTEEILCPALSKNVYSPQLPIQFWRKVSIERFTVHKPKTWE